MTRITNYILHRGKFQKSFIDRGEIVSNVAYSTSTTRCSTLAIEIYDTPSTQCYGLRFLRLPCIFFF